MIGWFNKRFGTSIEERNYGALYAGFSLLLFLTTLWAVYNEVDGRRPWKEYQADFRELKVQVLLNKRRELKGKLSKDELQKTDSLLEIYDEQLHGKKLAGFQSQIDDLAMTIRKTSQKRANLKSEADNRNYMFEHSSREQDPEAAKKYKDQRIDLEHRMADLDKTIDSMDKIRAKLLADNITPIASKKKALESKRDSIYGAVADLEKKIDEADAMPLQIQQVMLNDYDRTNFGKLQMRADRCQSCHMGITDPVFADTNIFNDIGKGRHLFRTKDEAAHARKVFGPHPHPEMLKSHNIERFGCTPCHGGQPMSVDAVDHAHGFESHWEKPLLTGAYVQGACRKCHEGDYTFAMADKVSEGRKLFIDFGCFGCHEGPSIPDWKDYKVGPSLMNIGRKISREWAFKWIQNPQSWNEHTRMPNFKFNDEQTKAVVAYLFDATKSSQYKPVSASVPAGDPARGAVTLKEVGCFACHAVDEFEPRGKFKFVPTADKKLLWPNGAQDGNRVAEGNNFGPDLNKIGSKVDAAWLFDWVKNPKHFNPNSRMPILRLTDGEAADITAYLMGKKDPSFLASPPALGNLDDKKLVEKGASIIREYGCFGCHQIPGMENEGKVSVSLADFGTKTAADLYFGYLGEEQLHDTRAHFDKGPYKLGKVYMHLEDGEDWFVWTALKMKNSRVFQTDAIAQKMPVFNMTDEEAYAMTVALRSYTKAYIPASFKDPLGQYQPAVNDGHFLTHWNNCVGCHKIQGSGGFVLENLRTLMGIKGDDINPYGPPNLNTAGAKIQEPWFYNFIRNPASTPVRTWLKIRMPTYGFSPSEISRLDKFFLGLEGQSLQFTDYSYYPATEQTLAAGQQLWEKLKCQQCHAAGSTPSLGGATAVPAPNLALAGGRLKPEWIVRWISDPQAIAPGTKMPNFFGTLQEPAAADPTILGGDWKAQVSALRDYVWRIGGAKGTGSSATQADSSSMHPAAAPAVEAKNAAKPADSAAKKTAMRSVPDKKLSMR
ncbi:MAG: putative octahem cytochrome c [Chlorobi bacterium]|nr:putative octahem cytochrome c [Chlorobiota bacterium]